MPKTTTLRYCKENSGATLDGSSFPIHSLPNRPSVVLDPRADPAATLEMEDDLMVLFVEPECAWVYEWLVIPCICNMTDLGFT